MSGARVHAVCPSALLVDLYELTMMQAYCAHGIEGRATFDLFVRRLPAARNFLLVAGLENSLEFLRTCFRSKRSKLKLSANCLPGRTSEPVYSGKERKHTVTGQWVPSRVLGVLRA